MSNNRKIILSKIQTLLERHVDYGMAIILAARVESAAYNAVIKLCAQNALLRTWEHPQFLSLYSTRCGVILTHLDEKSPTCLAYGTDALKSLLAGKLSGSVFGESSDADLCPKALESELSDISLRRQQHVEQKSSNQYLCPGCGKRRCTYYTIQTRALDEDVTICCTCLECGQAFRG